MTAGAVASLAWLAALASFGIALLGRVAPWLARVERVAYGAVLGQVLGSLALLGVALLRGSLETGAVIGVGIAALAVALVLARGARPQAPGPAPPDPTPAWLPWLVLGALAVRWAFLWSHALEIGPAGLYAGHHHIWGDWSLHLGDTTAFAWGDNFPPLHPRYAGLPNTYHYLTSITCAAMVKLGMSPTAALPLHSFVGSMLVALATLGFARRLTGNMRAATLAVVLFLVGGGLGWCVTLGEVLRSHHPLATLLADPWDWRLQEARHLRWLNVFYAYVLPQRSTLYGFPLGMAVLACVNEAVRRRATRPFVIGGAIAGLLPLASLGAMLALAMITGVLFLLFASWRWLAFFAPWIALAVPQLLAQQGGAPGALRAFRWQLGWVAGPVPWWWFWLENLGLFVPLGLVALLARDLLPAPSRRFLLGFMPVFVAANLFVFQPWDWDNTKVMVWWFLAVCVLVAAWLARAWREHRSLPARIAWWMALLVLTLSGLLADLDQGLGRDRHLFLTREELEVARQVRERTPPHALFVVGTQNNHPVPVMAGRRVLMSYPGWLWSQGVDYHDREREVRAIYALAPDADSLMHHYRVSFVVVGPVERAELGADEAAWRTRFPAVVSTRRYRVYDVRGLTVVR
jgi:hypothetical protein